MSTTVRKVKSFRLDEKDIAKLEDINRLYKNGYGMTAQDRNMDGLHQWSQANTLTKMIRDTHASLKKVGAFENPTNLDLADLPKITKEATDN
ncbi:hypothetical protein [Bacillus wiedmannii]|uniref:hypothetical protein n=1 Tax=Bacillus wiedmannii TaxID=1890302 RepID=UPI000BF0BBED|nr:hypothetical protein [Bacillus wiedmannii]PEM08525.1 hypothetical protein CN610_19935 [Bacillus wiedmannii]